MNFDHFENSSIQVFSQYWGSQEFQVQEKRLLVLLCPADPTCPESVTILCWRQCPDDFFLLSTTLYERLLVTICNWRNYPMLTPPANAKNTFFLQDSEVHGELAFLFVCLTTMCPFHYSKTIIRKIPLKNLLAVKFSLKSSSMEACTQTSYDLAPNLLRFRL